MDKKATFYLFVIASIISGIQDSSAANSLPAVWGKVRYKIPLFTLNQIPPGLEITLKSEDGDYNVTLSTSDQGPMKLALSSDEFQFQEVPTGVTVLLEMTYQSPAGSKDIHYGSYVFQYPKISIFGDKKKELRKAGYLGQFEIDVERAMISPVDSMAKTHQREKEAESSKPVQFQYRKLELPDDLVLVKEAKYAPLEGLARGRKEAQTRQRNASEGLNIPVEVKSRKTEISFRLIPPGSFMRGSRSSNSQTPYRITLTQPFYCGKFEVTQGQWRAVTGKNPSKFAINGENYPVEQVTHEECIAFLRELCRIEGVPIGTYRLPTEAQWEYACRAGTNSPFYFEGGVDSLYRYGNYRDISNTGDGSSAKDDRHDDGYDKTAPVGTYPPNAYGLYDMHGNVWEVCQDCIAAYPKSDLTDPLGPPTGKCHVQRGGSWGSGPGFCRSGDSFWEEGRRESDLGFRIVRVILLPEGDRLSYVPQDSARFNGHSYKVFKEQLTWQAAKEQCQQMNGYLACITTHEENQFVLALAKKKPFRVYSCCWIGATDEGHESQWLWTTGETFRLTDNLRCYGGSKENFLNLRLSSGKWEDYPLEGERVGEQWFVCEWDH